MSRNKLIELMVEITSVQLPSPKSKSKSEPLPIKLPIRKFAKPVRLLPSGKIKNEKMSQGEAIQQLFNLEEIGPKFQSDLWIEYLWRRDRREKV